MENADEINEAWKTYTDRQHLRWSLSLPEQAVAFLMQLGTLREGIVENYVSNSISIGTRYTGVYESGEGELVLSFLFRPFTGFVNGTVTNGEPEDLKESLCLTDPEFSELLGVFTHFNWFRHIFKLNRSFFTDESRT